VIDYRDPRASRAYVTLESGERWLFVVLEGEPERGALSEVGMTLEEVPALRSAAPEVLDRLEVANEGRDVRWPDVGVTVSVRELVERVLEWMADVEGA
jgi:hypothetical protein